MVFQKTFSTGWCQWFLAERNVIQLPTNCELVKSLTWVENHLCTFHRNGTQHHCREWLNENKLSGVERRRLSSDNKIYYWKGFITVTLMKEFLAKSWKKIVLNDILKRLEYIGNHRCQYGRVFHDWHRGCCPNGLSWYSAMNIATVQCFNLANNNNIIIIEII